MEIKVRPLNKGETFTCSIKKAKEYFKNTSVVLNFAYTNRVYSTFANTPHAVYLKNRIKGIIVSSMFMSSQREKALLSFYVIKDKDMPCQLKNEFENNYLPEYLKFYRSIYNNKNPNGIESTMIIELINGTFKIHYIQ